MGHAQYDAQDDTVAAFESGALTGGVRPTRIDTHLSHVFLTPTRVYKLKRAIKLPFVDFTTQARRRAACEAELTINCRHARDLYIEVADIVRAADGTITLGGEGAAVDSVVVMKRFSDEDLFDTMAREGRLTPALIEETARVVAGFHAALAPGMGALSFTAVIDELEATEREGAVAHGLAPQGGAVFENLRIAHRRHASLLEARAAAGKVRHGHGDLHLRNICLFEGRPTLFDAIEFDSKIATSDVLYDFAFLLMDLVHRDLKTLASRALNCYFDAAREDETALAVLPFLMALRAAVRMAVLTQGGDQGEAAAYRTLALSLLAPCTPVLVAVGGLSGTGKSAVARELAPLLPGVCGARVLRSDVVRKEGATRPDYTQAARAEIYRALFARAQMAATGTSVIVDATFQDADQRSGMVAAADARPFIAVWLRAPEAARMQRVAGRHGDASDADAAIAAAQSEPAALEAPWHVIDASGTPQQTLARLCGLIAPHRAS